MKVWFLLMFKSSFSPIDKSTCKGKQYFHTSWPELFIFEDLVLMPRLYGLWILPQSQMQSDREEEESALCSIRGWWAGYLIEYIFFSPLCAQRILDSLSHPGYCYLVIYIKCSSTASTNRRPISIFLLPIRGQKFGHCLPAIHGCD